MRLRESSDQAIDERFFLAGLDLDDVRNLALINRGSRSVSRAHFFTQSAAQCRPRADCFCRWS